MKFFLEISSLCVSETIEISKKKITCLYFCSLYAFSKLDRLKLGHPVLLNKIQDMKYFWLHHFVPIHVSPV